MTESQTSAPSAPPGTPEPDFSSVHTTGFPLLLRELDISLLVSTYQAGKLIILRENAGVLNTHFRQFVSPMGIAFDPATNKLALGTRHQVWTFRNHPRVSNRLPSDVPCDAVFLPRHCYFTGDIRIHDIAWAEEELWAVNTRFSCLCTFDGKHSFVPRWRPPFVTALAAEDRCHLNGLAMEDGRPRLVTLLARTDVAGGWRNCKRDGGCLWDLQANAPMATGLSMPHSPRFYDGRAWFLNSGHGTLCAVDLASGVVTEIARVPGFTRGLCFAGSYAFVGLSQVRESAIFGGVPIAETPGLRACGVWVIDIRNGATAAFLRFEGVVQEIFAVEALPGFHYPELINEPGDVLDSSFVLPPDGCDVSASHSAQ